MKALLPLALLVLTACADWPDTGAPAPSQRASDWPALLPVSDIIATDSEGRLSDATATALAARAAALRARAALLRRDLETQAEMDALRARLAR